MNTSTQADNATMHCHLLEWTQMGQLPECNLQHLLGGLVVGVQARRVADAVAKSASEMPLLPLAAPLLNRDRQACGELWLSRSAVTSGVAEGVSYRCDGQLLYGVVSVDEAAFGAAGEGASSLRRAAEYAYERIFALLDQLDYPHLWRVWNYLANINGDADAEGRIERYRQFNIGRYQAFSACNRMTSDTVPAASALGVTGGSILIGFMAGRTAPLSLENPRQMPAYEYPATYGPRSPTFARAVLTHLPGQELLFVSGTASIVGHASMHVGDVAAQTRETLANIAAVINQANERSPSVTDRWALSRMIYRTYIRHAADFETVHNEVLDVLGETATVIYVQADVCRTDLLVEIEAFASRAVAAPPVWR